MSRFLMVFVLRVAIFSSITASALGAQGAADHQRSLPSSFEVPENALSLDLSRSSSFWLGRHYLWHSSDMGDSWSRMSPLLARAPHYVSAIAFAPVSEAVLVGLSDGRIYWSEKPQSEGEWLAVRPRDGVIVEVGFDSADSSVAYALFDDREEIWFTVDRGHTWQPFWTPARHPLVEGAGDFLGFKVAAGQAEFLANSYTTSDQYRPAIASSDNGDFVVVWESYGATQDQYFSIQAQRYSSSGSKQGDQFQVNTYTTNQQVDPTVAAAADGRFVIAWESLGGPPGSDTSQLSVRARRFNSAGSPLGGDFQVNTYEPVNQRNPSVAARDNGDFVITWESKQNGVDNSSFSVQAQRYFSDGTPAGAEFQVNTYTLNDQFSPSVAMERDDGVFVVVWESYGSNGGDTSGWSILGQRFDSAGGVLAAEFQVNTYTTLSQRYPSVSVANDGSFAVVWQSLGSSSGDVSGNSVKLQQYDSAGQPLAAEVQVNTYSTGDQKRPDVAMDVVTRELVVLWEDAAQDAGGPGIFGQQFNATGAKEGAEFQVNTYTPSMQSEPAVAIGDEGDFVAVWQSFAWSGGGVVDIDNAIAARQFVVQRADVTVTVTAITPTAVPGTSTASFKIEVENIGPSAAPLIHVENYFSSAIQNPDWTCQAENGAECPNGLTGQAGSGDIEHDLELNNGKVTFFALNLSIAPDATGVLENCASASSSEVQDPAPSNNTDRCDDLDLTPEAELRVEKINNFGPGDEIVPGESLVTYTIQYCNDGPSAAGTDTTPGVVIRDDFPLEFPYPALSCGATGGATCPTGLSGGINKAVKLPANSCIIINASRVPPPWALSLSNTAWVEYEVGALYTDPGNQPNSQTDDDSAIVKPKATLSITKAADQNPAAAGGNLRYTITVGNQGPSYARNVVVSDPLPAEVLLVASSTSSGSCSDSNGVVSCNLVSLAPNSSAQVAIDVTIDLTVFGSIVNTASVSSPNDQGSPRVDDVTTTVEGDFQINTGTTDLQETPSVAAASNGDFLVTWASTEGGSKDIKAQRYGSSGSRLGSELLVNTSNINGNQTSPDAAMSGTGKSVIVWSSDSSEYGEDPGTKSIQAQRFDASGQATGPEFRVNSYTIGSQRLPAVAIDQSGGFIAVWESYGSPGSDNGYSIVGRSFASNGWPEGPDFQVNTYTTGGQFHPAVAMSETGDFVVVWEASYTLTDPSRSIQGQLFSSSGSSIGGEFQVNTYTTGDQSYPAVVMDRPAGGASQGFMVTWQSFGSPGTDNGQGFAILAQYFDGSGSPVGGEFQVNTTTAGDQKQPSVAYFNDGLEGEYVFVWHNEDIAFAPPGYQKDGKAGQAIRGIFSRKVRRPGPKMLVNEDQINTLDTFLFYGESDVAMGGNSALYVWRGDSEIYGRRISIVPGLLFMDGFESGDYFQWDAIIIEPY